MARQRKKKEPLPDSMRHLTVRINAERGRHLFCIKSIDAYLPQVLEAHIKKHFSPDFPMTANGLLLDVKRLALLKRRTIELLKEQELLLRSIQVECKYLREDTRTIQRAKLSLEENKDD